MPFSEKQRRNPPRCGESPLEKGGNFIHSVFKTLKSKIDEVYPLFFGTTATTTTTKRSMSLEISSSFTAKRSQNFHGLPIPPGDLYIQRMR